MVAWFKVLLIVAPFQSDVCNPAWVGSRIGHVTRVRGLATLIGLRDSSLAGLNPNLDNFIIIPLLGGFLSKLLLFNPFYAGLGYLATLGVRLLALHRRNAFAVWHA